MQHRDPLAVLVEAAPRFSDEEAVAIAREYYGLEVAAKSLVSERDQNFRLRTAAGVQYVLKIANAAEAPEVTDFQIRALLHIAGRKRQDHLPVGVPEIVRTVDGETSIRLQSACLYPAAWAGILDHFEPVPGMPPRYRSALNP